ncbi:MAG TPA: acyltransferase [Tepidisphaeraceae bacterium]|jgi:peptidoglycan/LPS O-acetylase OafA/YrhL
MTGKARNLRLDVLRGVAIVLVLCSHTVVWGDNAGWARHLAKGLQMGGWTGVDLFFVLSGFLIGGLLFKEIDRSGTLDVRRFLTRRAFKIWPAYFVFLAYAIGRSEHHAPTAWAGIRPLLPNLIHLQNYLGTSGPTPYAHTWSLAVEEHFYLALPILLLALCRWHKVSWIPAATLVIGIACLTMRLQNWGKPYEAITHYMPTHLRADSLMFGVLLAYVYHLRPAALAFVPRVRLILVIVGVVLVAPMFSRWLNDPWAFTVGYTTTYLGMGCILIACVDAEAGLLGRVLGGPVGRVLAFIGFYSYSIYLWHWAAREKVLQYLHSAEAHGAGAYFLMTAADIAIATAFGVISAKLVEQPFLALRDRIFPSRTPAGPVQKTAGTPLPPQPEDSDASDRLPVAMELG